MPVVTQYEDLTQEEQTMILRLQNVKTYVEHVRKSGKEIRETIFKDGKKITSGDLEKLADLAAKEETLYPLVMQLDKTEEFIWWVDRRPNLMEACNEELKAWTKEVTDYWMDRYLRWYRPNSTSNFHVEIQLMAHEADLQIVKMLTGRW